MSSVLHLPILLDIDLPVNTRGLSEKKGRGRASVFLAENIHLPEWACRQIRMSGLFPTMRSCCCCLLCHTLEREGSSKLVR